MRMPTLRVRYRDPAHHFGKFSIVSRPQNKMPVVGHQTVRRYTNTGPFVCFLKNLFKSQIVGGPLKELQSTHTPVEHVVGQSPARNPSATRYRIAFTNVPLSCQ